MRKQSIFAVTVFAAVSLGCVPNAAGQQAQVPGPTQKTRTAQPSQRAEAADGAQKSPAQAAKASAPQPHIPPGMRTLTLQEGRAIVQKMAWADDEEGLSPDCSHLVHTLYEQAGYSYTYASSLDLYRGAESFVRVRVAHPGDLIVWRGHVGIVMNPKEHSFFSSESTGARIGHYDSAYWRARGYARFYRYLTSKAAPSRSGTSTMSVMNRLPEPAPRLETNQSNTENRPSLQEVRAAPIAANKAHVDATAGSNARAETVSASSVRAESSLQIPLRTAGKRPGAADVASALQVANLDAGEILRNGDLWRLERPVVVYRDLQVGAVEVKGKRGIAKVQFETLATLSAKRMESQQGREEHQLELQQTKKGWVMTPANGNAYVPREAALRILAGRLALLTQSAETSAEKEHEQADIIRFMNLLIE